APIVLWFSRATREWITPARERSLKELGAGISDQDDGRDATHVVVGRELRRTMRVMCAICRGQYVVGDDWLRASIRAKRWADPLEHLPRSLSRRMAGSLEGARAGALEPEEAVRAAVSAAIGRARARPLLAGCSVYVFPSVQARAAVQRLVEVAGGASLQAPPSAEAAGTSGEAARPALFLLGTEADSRAAAASGLPLFQAGLLFEAAMSQQLNLQSPVHRLQDSGAKSSVIQGKVPLE
ncbi:unnamed protein product, partial [Prorocentrum cordatum]